MAQYTSAYFGDTITWDRLTLNAGLRWDRQAGSVKALSQTGNPVLPTLLPDLTSTAADDVVVWNSITPRIGLTYALDDARKTIGRVSYGMFASQMNATAGGFMSTITYRGVYFYDVLDTNGNRVVDPSEIAGRTCSDALAIAGECNYSGFDINNPWNVAAPIHTVGDYSTPMTHEFQLGLDREVATNFGISGTFTWRNFNNFVWRNNGLTGADYVPLGNFTGTHPAIGDWSIPLYGAPADAPPGEPVRDRVPEARGLLAAVHGLRAGRDQAAVEPLDGTLRVLHQQPQGVLRRPDVDGRSDVESDRQRERSVPVPNQDGGTVVRSSGGSGKSGIFQVLPSYQFIATGLYQAKWGINFAANMVNRQGFAMQYSHDQVDSRLYRTGR